LWKSNGAGNTVEWLMATTFGVGYQTATPNANGTRAIATGDFNRDNTIDILWYNDATGATAEWLMTPKGGVGAVINLPNRLGWKLDAYGDFDGNGTVDLFWERTSDGATREWLLNPIDGAIASDLALPGTGRTSATSPIISASISHSDALGI
jgi:hypothetical protein